MSACRPIPGQKDVQGTLLELAEARFEPKRLEHRRFSMIFDVFGPFSFWICPGEVPRPCGPGRRGLQRLLREGAAHLGDEDDPGGAVGKGFSNGNGSVYINLCSFFVMFHRFSSFLFIFVFVESRFGWFRKRIWVLSAFWCSTAFLLEAKK